jgi:hypothetical protein
VTATVERREPEESPETSLLTKRRMAKAKPRQMERQRLDLPAKQEVRAVERVAEKDEVMFAEKVVLKIEEKDEEKLVVKAVLKVAVKVEVKAEVRAEAKAVVRVEAKETPDLLDLRELKRNDGNI